MISKEAWYREAMSQKDIANITQVFQSWDAPISSVKAQHECDVHVKLPLESARKVRQNLSKIQRDLRTIGWRIIYWREKKHEGFYEGEMQDVHLHSVVPVTEQRDVYYHLSPRENLDSILSQGLLPRRNYEYVLNPRPAIYLSPDVTFLKGQVLGEAVPHHLEPVLLEVRVPLSHELYVDCEYAGFGGDDTAVYSTKKIPPENIRVVDFEQTVYEKALAGDKEAVLSHLRSLDNDVNRLLPLEVIEKSLSPSDLQIPLNIYQTDDGLQFYDMEFSPEILRGPSRRYPFVDVVKWLRKNQARHDRNGNAFVMKKNGETFYVDSPSHLYNQLLVRYV